MVYFYKYASDWIPEQDQEDFINKVEANKNIKDKDKFIRMATRDPYNAYSFMGNDLLLREQDAPTIDKKTGAKKEYPVLNQKIINENDVAKKVNYLTDTFGNQAPSSNAVFK